MILPLALALAVTTGAFAAPPDTAYLTFESGELVGVDWVQRRGSELRTRCVLMRSAIRDVRIVLGPAGTARHSATVVSQLGKPDPPPVERDLGDDVVYWSDQVASSLEQELWGVEC